MELNPNILLVIRWLNDKNSVSVEELRVNAGLAYSAINRARAVYDVASAAYEADYGVAPDASASVAESQINKFFDESEHKRNDYIDALDCGAKNVINIEVAEGVVPFGYKPVGYGKPKSCMG